MYGIWAAAVSSAVAAASLSQRSQNYKQRLMAGEARQSAWENSREVTPVAEPNFPLSDFQKNQLKRQQGTT